MPLPDALPDKRIYQLLKTTDLENLTFSDFQGVAEKIYAEQGAEDELRRIVLVNLARLAVKGEWNGLTDAGGGGGAHTYTIPTGLSGVSYGTTTSGYGQNWNGGTSSVRDLSEFNTPSAFPLIAQAGGTVASITARVTTAQAGAELYVGIYDSDFALMGFATFDASSTGYLTQTSLSATITLEAGTGYWIVFGNNGSAGSCQIRRTTSEPNFGIVQDATDEFAYYGWKEENDATSLPATFVPYEDVVWRPIAYYALS